MDSDDKAYVAVMAMLFATGIALCAIGAWSDVAKAKATNPCACAEVKP